MTLITQDGISIIQHVTDMTDWMDTRKLSQIPQLLVLLGHDSALLGYAGPGTTWANEMNFVMNHAPGAGSIA